MILLVSILTFAAAVLGYLSSLNNKKKITELTVRVDGRLDQLMANFGKSEKAEGNLQGRAEEKQEQQDRDQVSGV